MRSTRTLGVLLVALAATSCTNEPIVVASNENPLEINAVDILLVVDDSGYEFNNLITSLPSLLDAFIAGSDEPGHERPRLTDLHVAVVSTDMGVSVTGYEPWTATEYCDGLGRDGVFATLSGEQLEQCSEPEPFLAYEQGVARTSTADAIACLPSAHTNCVFEQPLEAMLKSMWPASDESVEFLEGASHGDGVNAGFLREDSLLVVIVVTDEDDCSVVDPSIFNPQEEISFNARCGLQTQRLYAIERYVDGLRALREGDDPILFAVVGGIPPHLVDAEAQAAVDFSDESAVEAYYDAVLESPEMQFVIDEQGTVGPGQWADDRPVPVCTKAQEGYYDHEGSFHSTTDTTATPARRLVEVAKRFGKAGVLGSVCEDGFAETIGSLIRATAERL